MPHFILDCSQNIIDSYDQESLIRQVHQVAEAAGLFNKNDIKVRINPYQKFLVGNQKEDFIHVFTYIMQGRSTEQKAELSKQVVKKLVSLFPEVANIAMNISEFEKATYCNRTMV